ncbi:MAG: right-handed parallel beta-helix repeat-containing protein, partial [Candidatus Micrarchaeota archaeon]|nr:right-handed parallel beta-helix repeat-containing protein [Candidatus Micrarchaeota archaeon]
MFFARWSALFAFALVLAVSAQAVTTVSDCGQAIDAAGETYELNQSISSAGATCLTAAADNVTIDCKGFSITGDDVTSSTYGVSFPDRYNVTVKNCNISDYYTGIYLWSATSSTITNNSISSCFSTNGDGINAAGSYHTAYNITITYNNITSNAGMGIRITSTYANVSYNNISFNGGRAIDADNAPNSTFSYNTLDFNSHFGIRLSGDAFWSVISNNVVNNTAGSGLEAAISVIDYTTVENNIVVNTSVFFGISIGAYNCTLTNNTVNNGMYGIAFSHGFNTFRNNSMNGNTMGLVPFCTGPAECYDNDIDTSNTANGEPIYYLNHKTNYVLENLELTAANTSLFKVAVLNSDNVTIRNIVIKNNQGDSMLPGYGVAIGFSNNSVVSNVTVSDSINAAGFVISTGAYNTLIEDCSATGNKYGIQLLSSGNTVKNCNLTGNTGFNIDSGGYPVSLSGGGTSIQYSSLSTSGEVSDAVYYAGTGVAAVNASANNDLNTSAQITMTITGQCPTVNLYYYNDFTTDLNTIIASGQLCNST